MRRAAEFVSLSCSSPRGRPIAIRPRPRLLRARHFKDKQHSSTSGLLHELSTAGARGRLPRRGGLAGRTGTRGVGAGRGER